MTPERLTRDCEAVDDAMPMDHREWARWWQKTGEAQLRELLQRFWSCRRDRGGNSQLPPMGSDRANGFRTRVVGRREGCPRSRFVVHAGVESLEARHT